jgi:hypothetical protein
MDWLKAVLAFNLIALGVSVVTAAVLAWQNAGSRNIGLAAGTLAATALLFVLQLAFELRRPDPILQTYSADLTLDRLTNKIRQWRYTSNYEKGALIHNADRVTYEDPAGPAIVKENPKVFDGDRDYLSQQMLVFTVVTLLLRHETDWQLNRILYRGSTLGSIGTAEFLSQRGEYTEVPFETIRAKVKESGNPFWVALGGPFVTQSLRLPPGSTLNIFPGIVEIVGPFCKIRFSTDSRTKSVDYRNPADGSDPIALPNGASRFETRVINVDVRVEFFALRAFSLESSKYKKWTTRLLDDARMWFGIEES